MCGVLTERGRYSDDRCGRSTDPDSGRRVSVLQFPFVALCAFLALDHRVHKERCIERPLNNDAISCTGGYGVLRAQTEASMTMYTGLFFFTGRMPRSGKLPVLFLLTGQKSGFSPRRGDSLHRFRSSFAVPTGTWVRLAGQNFTSIGADGWECGPQNIKNFHFLVKSRRAGATPLTDFRNF